MSIRLSKSKLLAFRQCPKRLWLEVNRPDLRVDDESAKQRFMAGNRIGELARTQYADGVLIAPDNHLASALRETAERLRDIPRKVLFEATFQSEGLLVRADMLIPARNGWHMVEVKSSAGVKAYHLEDAAIQRWVMRNVGIAISNTSLQLVDTAWTYPGGGNYSGLLKSEPVDKQIGLLQTEVPKWLNGAKNVAGGSEPKCSMGKHCNDPFACGFQDYCETLAPLVQYPISWLPRLGAKAETFAAAGIDDMRKVPASELTKDQRRVLDATLQNELFFDALTENEIEEVSGIRCYLDFETIAFAAPIWAGTRPYQQIPFQWSCHIEQVDGSLSHEMFLDMTGDDPSRRCAESLVKALGKKGPIIAYSAGFEKGAIKALAERFDDLAPALMKLVARVVDLLPLVRTHYYHPDMCGSSSLKRVLPTIAPELDYAMLTDVADGGAAQGAYLEAIHADTLPARKFVLENALRTYCHRDTEAMIRILHHLQHNSLPGFQG